MTYAFAGLVLRMLRLRLALVLVAVSGVVGIGAHAIKKPRDNWPPCEDSQSPCLGVGAVQQFSAADAFGSMNVTFVPPCPSCTGAGNAYCKPVLDYYVSTYRS